MSTFTDLEKDAASVDGFANENGLIETRRNGPKPSYQYLVDGWNSAQAQNLADNTAAVNTLISESETEVNELLERTSGVGRDNAYETTSAGLAATVDGDYFSVVSPAAENYLDLYKNDGGTAVFQKSYPSSLAVSELSGEVEYLNETFKGWKRVVASKNLFNKNAVISGVRIAVGSGNTYSAASYTTSEYIPVEPSEVYMSSSPVNYAIYDSDKTYISGELEETTMSIGANGAFIRVSFAESWLDEAVVSKTKRLASYEPYSTGVIAPDLVYDEDQIKNITVDNDYLLEGIKVNGINADFLNDYSVNLYNKDSTENLSGRTLNWFNGTTTARADSSVTEYIKVEPNTEYITSEASNISFYDADKVYVSGFAPGTSKFTTGENVEYMRQTVRNSVIDATMILKGDYIPEIYQPFQQWGLNENTIEVTQWYGKKWNVMGDSITEVASGYTAYWKVLAPLLGFYHARNYGIGGTAIAVRNAPWDDNAMCVRYVDMDDDADLITVMGGTNDFSNVPLGTPSDTINTTFYGALKILCEGLVNKYPTKSIGFITMPPRANMMSNNRFGFSFSEYSDAIKSVCKDYAIPVFDTAESTSLRPYNQDNANALMPDGLHPNNKGHEVIATALKSWILSL